MRERVPDSEVKKETVARRYGDTETGRSNGSEPVEKEGKEKDRDGKGCNGEIETIA